MKRLVPAFLFVIMALAVMILSGCGEEYGTVQGTVTQALDSSKPLDDPSNVGTGVAEAEIVVFALEKFEDIQGLDVFKRGEIVQRMATGNDGAFSFSLFKGEYMIEVVVNHKIMDSRQIEVKGGRTSELDFNIKATP